MPKICIFLFPLGDLSLYLEVYKIIFDVLRVRTKLIFKNVPSCTPC